LRQDDWQRSQLVTFGWLHGKRYGGHLASTMIMDVIMNRVRLGWGTVAEVIHSYPEKAANPIPETVVPHIWSPEFIRLLHECEGCFDGSTGMSKGALYFCDTSDTISEWFQERILDSKELHPCVGNMNSLMFFR
jgi:hypothetical protein